jgi:hypothetical protein
MKQQETIEAFCALLSEVRNEVFLNKYAADCFCQGHQPGFQHEDIVFIFIKQAVKEKIEREKSNG